MAVEKPRHYTEHVGALNGKDPSELHDLRRYMETLGDSPAWRLVRMMAERVIAAEQLALETSGKPLEQAEYAMRLGRIAGARAVLEAPASVIYAAEEARRRAESADARSRG
jgi:hypothetical protein